MTADKKTTPAPAAPKQVVDAAYCRFGIRALLDQLHALEGEVAGVRSSEDPECIHRMRVATRRLRSMLPAFRECFPAPRVDVWEKGIRRITRALGAARDADVQLDVLVSAAKRLPDPACEPGMARLTLRLRQQREQLQARVLDMLRKLEETAFLTEMQIFLLRTDTRRRLRFAAERTPCMYARAHALITGCLNGLLEYEPFVAQPERARELHLMRIAAKRLRYTMQTFAALYEDNLKEPLDAARAVQTLLGDLHDCDVWDAFIPQFIEEERARTLEYFGHLDSFADLLPGLNYWRENRRQTRETVYREFTAAWQRLHEAQVWQQLTQSIALPTEPRAESATAPAKEPSTP